MKIAFLTTGHCPFDDRIFFHLAKALSEEGKHVEVISTRVEITGIIEGITISSFDGNRLSKMEKISGSVEKLSAADPGLIICSGPMALIAAVRYARSGKRRVRMIYDITEWYPSKKQMARHKAPVKYIMFLKYLFFNLYASSLADAFIFGEWYKSRPYRLLFPLKPFTFITYYPNLKYLPYKPPHLQENSLRLCFAGKISREKGIINLLNVIGLLVQKIPGIRIELQIIGWYESPEDRMVCEPAIMSARKNVNIIFHDRKPFLEFIEFISDTDIFIDLRSDDPENQRCLPIKLFYYAALGRPVIFSSLKSIKKEIETGSLCHLVRPDDPEQVVSIISGYLHNHEMYLNHCIRGRRLAVEKYNWDRIKPDLLNFVNGIAMK
jgi:glycosyltransferase involved in cell wall biosynthesis